MSSPKSKGCVLICDDEGGIRDILVRLVRREGYDALEAADGITALAVIRQQSPDILLLDIRMPGLDGVEVVRRARQLTPDLPIVMITTAMAADASAALRCGAVRTDICSSHFGMRTWFARCGRP